MSGKFMPEIANIYMFLLVKKFLAILSNCGKIHNNLLIPNGKNSMNWINSQPNPLMDAVQRLNVNRLVKSLRYSLVCMRNHAVDRWVVQIARTTILETF